MLFLGNLVEVMYAVNAASINGTTSMPSTYSRAATATWAAIVSLRLVTAVAPIRPISALI